MAQLTRAAGANSPREIGRFVCCLRGERPAEKERATEYCDSVATIHGLTSPTKGSATILHIRGDIPARESPLCNARRYDRFWPELRPSGAGPI